MARAQKMPVVPSRVRLATAARMPDGPSESDEVLAKHRLRCPRVDARVEARTTPSSRTNTPRGMVSDLTAQFLAARNKPHFVRREPLGVFSV
jgi:hypothetical protein